MQPVLAVEERFGCESSCTCSCAAKRISDLESEATARSAPMLRIDTPGVLEMLVRTAKLLTDDEAKIVRAVMVGSNGTANPEAVRAMVKGKR